MKIEVLYFEGCPNHPPAVELAKSVVAELGVGALVEQVEVKTEADAKRLRFFGSPTVQVDGVDIEPGARARGQGSLGRQEERDQPVRQEPQTGVDDLELLHWEATRDTLSMLSAAEEAQLLGLLRRICRMDNPC